VSFEIDRGERTNEERRENSRTGVSVKQSRSLDHLLPLGASFALEVVVGIALGLIVEEEEFSKVVEREVSFRRFRAVVDDASGE